jgi:hypothetical protein
VLALRIRKGNVPPSLWASLGIVLAFWALGALALSGLRVPGSDRYAYMGAVGVLLVATDAARGTRFSKLGLAALFAACAISLATNVALLRDAGRSFRDSSTEARAQFGALELARGHVDPEFAGITALGVFKSVAPAGPYFDVLDEYGTLGLSLAELESQSESVRQGADRVLADALELRLEPSSARPAGECQRAVSTELGIIFELPAGGASISTAGGESAAVRLGRFGAPSVEMGSLPPDAAAKLRIPPDSSPKPWVAVVTGARSAEMCALS